MNVEYRLIGVPGRFLNGHGRRARHYAQKFRLLRDPARRVRSVSLKTTGAAAARCRVVRYVEDRVAEIEQRRDPQTRTAANHIDDALKEYLDHLKATGNSAKQAKLVETRIRLVIKKARLTEYSQVDAVEIIKAIAQLKTDHQLSTITANKYREAMRAWSRWMKRHGRWPTNPLEDMGKIKGDTSSRRTRAILADKQFEELLRVTRLGPMRRRLSGEQRYWL